MGKPCSDGASSGYGPFDALRLLPSTGSGPPAAPCANQYATVFAPRRPQAMSKPRSDGASNPYCPFDALRLLRAIHRAPRQSLPPRYSCLAGRRP